MTGFKTIDDTIESVVRQGCSECEILILRNDIKSLPQGTDVAEKNVSYLDSDYLLREIFIREKGKGNALNEGILRAKNNLVCVLDADCILKENALSQAVRHFENEAVVAVGGRLVVINENSSALERIQCCEYMKTFQTARRIFAKLNAQCLISGAFGVFRKSSLLEMGGYNTDTVGEDMELVLRLQDGGYHKSGNQIVYDPTAVCYTRVPHSLKRLLHQRDRWQRGLMDCLIKHQNMIANPRYGMLGLAAMSYQLVVELLGPIFWGVYACLLMWEKSSPFLSMVFVGYVMAQFGLTVISAHIDVDKNMRRLLKWLPKLILTTIEEMLLQILINVARSIGMITFYWRRLVW